MKPVLKTALNAAFGAAFGIWASASLADDVTLLSDDGSVEISGQLLGFDGEFYRLLTSFGELTVDGGGVTCDGPGCPNMAAFTPRVTVHGASAVADVLLPALITGFATQSGLTVADVDHGTHRELGLWRTGADHAAVVFEITSGTTSDGFDALIQGQADLAVALREITAEERIAAKSAGLGDLQRTGQTVVMALDALVPVVAPTNPVRQISPTTLRDVLLGEVTNWKQLGGVDAPISVYLPPSGSGVDHLISDLIVDDLEQDLNGSPQSVTSTMAEAVQTDPFGLAVVAKSEHGGARILDLSSGCGFALGATRRTVKTEDFPFTAPVFMYQPMRRLPKLAREFMIFVKSEDAQSVIRDAGLIDQLPEKIPAAVQGNRLANAILAAGSEVSLAELQQMTELLTQTTRLSLTVRFESGSSKPDALSRDNISVLAQALDNGEFDGQELFFVGFSDGDGSATANLEIAKRRAEIVRNTVMSAAKTVDDEQVSIQHIGFGEALPMACDDSEWGRRTNRRVEIWTRVKDTRPPAN